MYFQFSKIFTIYRHIGDIYLTIYRLSIFLISSGARVNPYFREEVCYFTFLRRHLIPSVFRRQRSWKFTLREGEVWFPLFILPHCYGSIKIYLQNTWYPLKFHMQGLASWGNRSRQRFSVFLSFILFYFFLLNKFFLWLF